MRRLCAGLLVLLLLAYAGNAARVGLANTAYFQARFLIDKWQRDPSSINQQNFQQASETIDRSVLLVPTNPHYLLTQAKVGLWGFYAGYRTAEQLEHLEVTYQSAVQQRPNWPETYADYAWYLSSVKQDLPGAWHQLQLAVQYGPYAADTLETVMKVALNRWPDLTPVQKATAYRWLAKSMHTATRNNVIALIKLYKKEFVACFYLKRQGNLSPELWALIEQQLCLPE
jgi:hypothetical protein